jgi:predicted MPP superfamily phosphohydrolase
MHRESVVRIAILILAAVGLLIQWYIYRTGRSALARWLVSPRRRRLAQTLWLALLVYVNLPYGYFILFGRPEYVAPIWRAIFLYPFGIWGTASLGTLIVLLLRDVLRTFWAFVSRLWKTSPRSEAASVDRTISRRSFLKSSASAAFGGLAVSPVFAATYGALVEARDLKIEELELAFPALPEGLDGLRVVQISDIHSRVYTPKEVIERVVQVANSLQPDLLFITGDFVSDSKRYIDPCAEALRQAEARYGKFGCLGNHDYYVGALDVRMAMAEAGITMLVNDGIEVEIAGERLNIAAVDDLWTGQPDVHRALKRIRRDHFTLMMNHNPNYFPFIAEQDVELTLSGHTHGGQINLSVLGLPLDLTRLSTPYVRGLFNIRRSKLYVNRGIGVTGPPIRFNSPPEITLIRLVRSSKQV